jgi:hypothetical protein
MLPRAIHKYIYTSIYINTSVYTRTVLKYLFHVLSADQREYSNTLYSLCQWRMQGFHTHTHTHTYIYIYTYKHINTYIKRLVLFPTLASCNKFEGTPIETPLDGFIIFEMLTKLASEACD